ncbi:MAG: 2-dehydro-3-deoxygalactonokinase [Burkholderiaceae bacterium]
MRRLAAIDWGTSSLRGALLDGAGTVLEEKAVADGGILNIPQGGFPAFFESHFGAWMQPGTLCLIAGMAGSQQGWKEAPYCACPAGFDEVAAKLAWIEPGRIAIVPGLSCEREGTPDVMRGEETQVLGAMGLFGARDGLFVLPGTHSKWVTVAGGRLESFATFMTGEFYSLLRRHSILSRTLPPDEGEFDAEAFDRGLAHAARAGSLLTTAFSVRTLSLFERMPLAARPSYLSGLVIGEELRCQPLAGVASVTAIGSEALTQRYERALASRGIAVRRDGSQATWHGLAALARQLEIPA